MDTPTRYLLLRGDNKGKLVDEVEPVDEDGMVRVRAVGWEHFVGGFKVTTWMCAFMNLAFAPEPKTLADDIKREFPPPKQHIPLFGTAYFGNKPSPKFDLSKLAFWPLDKSNNRFPQD